MFTLKKEMTKKDAYVALRKVLTNLKEKQGSGLALVYEANASLSFVNLIEEFKSNYPKAIIVEQDANYSKNRKIGLSNIVNTPVDVSYDFTKANVILAVDSDFMGIEGDNVKNARQFAEKRRIVNPGSTMNRLYSVESNFSITGTMADHHYTLRSGRMGDFLISIASELSSLGLTFSSEISNQFNSKVNLPDAFKKWIKAVARDLYLQKGTSLVVVGDRQPAWMHTLGFAINHALGVVGKVVTLIPDHSRFKESASFSDLKLALQKNTVQSLIVVGGNPVYKSPADFNLGRLFAKVENSFYLGYTDDETSDTCKYYFPKTHF